MDAQRYFEDVEIGDSFSETCGGIDRVQMFLFSAATYNAHRIHYDLPWAVEVEGYRDVVVQGPLQAALMAKTLTDWAGPLGRLTRIALQNRAVVHPDEALVFAGRVTAKRQDGDLGLIELEVREEKATGQVVMPGTATVALPNRPSRGSS